MLFITVRSASPTDVPKVLQVVEHVKRLRHKRGESPLLTFRLPRAVPLIRIHQTSMRGFYPKNSTNTSCTTRSPPGCNASSSTILHGTRTRLRRASPCT
jgi:hypothetical protein